MQKMQTRRFAFKEQGTRRQKVTSLIFGLLPASISFDATFTSCQYIKIKYYETQDEPGWMGVWSSWSKTPLSHESLKNRVRTMESGNRRFESAHAHQIVEGKCVRKYFRLL